jgi:hypothetical protein
MSDSLFLPRELFQPPIPRPAAPAAPAMAPRRSALPFASGAEVAADLMQAMQQADAPAFVERRRRPRSGKAFDTTR